MDRPVTIKEVAHKAGVGIATVSRVLNNSARVDPATRERVTTVIRRLAYRPNAQGRRLVKRSTEMVCFVLSNREFMNPFHSGVLCGAEKFLRQAGHDIVFTSLRYSRDTAPSEIALPRLLSNHGIVDGVILAGTNYPNLIAAMNQMRLPYVLLGNNLVERPSRAGNLHPDAVYYENDKSARSLAERLVKLGHHHIWFAGDTTMPWFRLRLESYRAVLRDHGLQLREYVVPDAGDYRDYGISYGEQAMRDILVSREPFTAILAGNDGIAYGIWKTLTRNGLRVPDDVSLVGFDDVQEARLTEPTLTTVQVPTDIIGEECARMLLDKLTGGVGGRSKPAVVVPTHVVERHSCGPAAAQAAKGQTA